MRYISAFNNTKQKPHKNNKKNGLELYCRN